MTHDDESTKIRQEVHIPKKQNHDRLGLEKDGYLLLWLIQTELEMS